MPKLSPSDWTAIKWYMQENDYHIKDMMVYPMVAFRTKEDEKTTVNIFDIKEKYKARRKLNAKQKAANE